MNETVEGNGTVASSRTCIIAAVFALPAVVCWVFARIFVFPVLLAVWQEANSSTQVFGMQASVILDATRILFSSILVPAILVFAILAFLGPRTGAWSCYRRRAIETAMWVVNAAVLLAMTCLCVGLAIVAHIH